MGFGSGSGGCAIFGSGAGFGFGGGAFTFLGGAGGAGGGGGFGSVRGSGVCATVTSSTSITRGAVTISALRDGRPYMAIKITPI